MRVRVVCGRGSRCHLAPEQGVHQRGLADVRAADQRGDPQRATASAVADAASSWTSLICSHLASQLLQQALRRLLFRAATARALAARPPVKLRYLATRHEPVLVRLAAHLVHRVDRQAEARACRCSCSRVLDPSVRAPRAVRPAARKQRLDDGTRRGDAAIEVHGAEQRLERVGEDGTATEPAALQFAATEPQLLTETKPGGERCSELPLTSAAR